MREKIENFIAMSGATLLIAVGTYFFKFPNDFTFGGITGLAVLIAKTGLISAADFSFVANMSLLILGAVILGKKFVAKTAYCSVLLSVALSLFERIFPMNQPFTNQPMLEHVPNQGAVRPYQIPVLLPSSEFNFLSEGIF